ncbi:MAG: VanZ family protein [Rhodospirillaceae bacterium]
MSEHAVILRAARRYVAGSPVRARVTVVLALCALTALLFLTDIRWATVRSAIVPGFGSGTWSASDAGASLLRDDPSVAVLEALPGPASSYVALRLLQPFSASHVRVSVEAKAEGLRDTAAPWQKVRVILYNFAADGRHLSYLPHMVAEIDGPGDWRRFGLVTPVPREVASHRLIAFNGAEDGRLVLRNLAVDSVTERDYFVVLRLALVALWIVAGAWVAYPLVRRPPAGFALRIALAACLLIAVAGLTPQPEWSRAIGGAVGMARQTAGAARDAVLGPRDRAPARAPAQAAGSSAIPRADGLIPVPGDRAVREQLDGGVFHIWPPKVGTGPVAHFFGFAVAGFLLSLGLRSAPRHHVLWYLLLLALATELLQSFHFSRATELEDLAMNAAGIAVGVAAATVFLAFGGVARPLARRLTMG